MSQFKLHGSMSLYAIVIFTGLLQAGSITGQYGATFSHKISPWSCMVLELVSSQAVSCELAVKLWAGASWRLLLTSRCCCWSEISSDWKLSNELAEGGSEEQAELKLPFNAAGDKVKLWLFRRRNQHIYILDFKNQISYRSQRVGGMETESGRFLSTQFMRWAWICLLSLSGS